MSRAIYELLTDCIAQLDNVKKQLERTAELLIEVRGRGSGLDMRDDTQRHREDWADDFGPE